MRCGNYTVSECINLPVSSAPNARPNGSLWLIGLTRPGRERSPEIFCDPPAVATRAYGKKVKKSEIVALFWPWMWWRRAGPAIMRAQFAKAIFLTLVFQRVNSKKATQISSSAGHVAADGLFTLDDAKTRGQLQTFEDHI